MNNINNNFFTGGIQPVYWADDSKSTYLFEENKTGVKQDEFGNLSDFQWKVNENGILALVFIELKTTYYWKVDIERNESDFVIQLFERKDGEKKHNQVKSFVATRNSLEKIEEMINESNTDKIKAILNEYNYINYMGVSLVFLLTTTLLYILFSYIVIVKDFTFIFKFALAIIIQIFLSRGILLLAHHTSCKIRKIIEDKIINKKDS